MLRSCIRGHGYIATGRRCQRCEKERDVRRGSRQSRGYDETHFRIRRQLEATLPALCGYCGLTVLPSERWVAAHVVDGERTSPRFAAHGRCNERAKVRRVG